MNQEAYYAPINFFGDVSDSESNNDAIQTNTIIANEAKILNKINQDNVSMDTKTDNDNDISPLNVKTIAIESDHESSDISSADAESSDIGRPLNKGIFNYNNHDSNIETHLPVYKGQSLLLASRANQIYQQQVEYMVKHLKSIKSMVSQKKDYLNKLLWQYKPSSLNNIEPNIDPKKIDDIYQSKHNQLRLIILENFEIRVCNSF